MLSKCAVRDIIHRHHLWALATVLSSGTSINEISVHGETDLAVLYDSACPAVLVK